VSAYGEFLAGLRTAGLASLVGLWVAFFAVPVYLLAAHTMPPTYLFLRLWLWATAATLGLAYLVAAA